MDFMYSLSIKNVYKSYFFLIMQATIYYPHFDEKIQNIIDTEKRYGKNNQASNTEWRNK